MRVVLSSSTAEAVSTVVIMIVDKIESHPASVIGLATGRTMEPVYAEWVKVAQERLLKLDQSFYFMLDEYVGLPDPHPESFKAYIQKRLLNPLDIKNSQISFPPAVGSNLEMNALDYERLLKESGGIDLQLLGVGTNGHIGFNEPGSDKYSRTRLVKLTQETREANKNHFPEGHMPREALSMGIGTILEAKSLVLLATGKSKADAIKYLMNHHDDSNCPITFLKSHPDFTLVIDPDAASKINLKI
jgi:glucosamine-6-phosphate deaminase